ncbi:hypothetical protein [Microbispora rosea]|uniref:hypothetical protein n=1 Tax=Microbispora rosea TaxID=58117 RepID=UPI0037B3EC72
MSRERLVYVITDAPERNPWRRLGQQIREALRPSVLVGVLAVPVMAATSVPVGLILGWPPFLIFCGVVIGGPVLVNLVDLIGARLGWPPLSWVATQILTRRPAVPSKETRVDE